MKKMEGLKRKKKWIAFLGCILVFCLCAGSVSAAGRFSGDPDAERELSQVIEDLEEGKAGMAVSADALDAEAAYKVHLFDEPDLVRAYREKQDLSAMVSDKVSWIIPANENRVLNVAYDSSKQAWGVVVENNVGKDVYQAGAAVDLEALKETLEDRFGEFSDPVYYYSGPYYSTFALVEADGAEYLIPYTVRPDFSGLENGAVYPVEEVMKAYEENWGPLPEEDADQGGGAGTGTSLEWLYWAIPLAAVLLAGVVLVAVSAARRKRSA